MVKSRIEETEEEFDARMAEISSESNKPQAKPIESSKEVFRALFSASLKED